MRPSAKKEVFFISCSLIFISNAISSRARPLLVVLEENSRDLFALSHVSALTSSNIQANLFQVM